MTLPRFLKEKQATVHLLLLVVAVGVFVLRASGLKLDPEIASAVAFSVIAYILFDISNNTNTYSRNKVYRQEVDMFPDLLKWIDEKGAKEAQVIHYSGKMVSVVLRKLLDKGASITLWLEDPEFACSGEQRDRIKSSVSGMAGELKVSGQWCLTAFHYQVPASIRGILIDKKLLVIG